MEVFCIYLHPQLPYTSLGVKMSSQDSSGCVSLTVTSSDVIFNPPQSPAHPLVGAPQGWPPVCHGKASPPTSVWPSFASSPWALCYHVTRLLWPHYKNLPSLTKHLFSALFSKLLVSPQLPDVSPSPQPHLPRQWHWSDEESMGIWDHVGWQVQNLQGKPISL